MSQKVSQPWDRNVSHRPPIIRETELAREQKKNPSTEEERLVMSNYRIRSGMDLVSTEVPEILYRIEGLLRADGGRMSITGQWKSEKSLLAEYLALSIAKGDDWLGFKTTPGNVLYVNLEIAEEKFQERTQDFCHDLRYQASDVSRFKAVTILDENLSLDSATSVVEQLLSESENSGFRVETLILDPRARLVAQSENEEVVIKKLCENVDKVLRNSPGLSVVFVTPMGKDPTKGAIGHSRFAGWVDTDIAIVKDSRLSCSKKLQIVGRDTEGTDIHLDFSYPLHRVTTVQEDVRNEKVDRAKKFVLAQLNQGEMARQQLLRLARTGNHSHYAYTTALKDLTESGQIESVQAPGPGNRKLLRIKPHT